MTVGRVVKIAMPNLGDIRQILADPKAIAERLLELQKLVDTLNEQLAGVSSLEEIERLKSEAGALKAEAQTHADALSLREATVTDHAERVRQDELALDRARARVGDDQRRVEREQAALAERAKTLDGQEARLREEGKRLDAKERTLTTSDQILQQRQEALAAAITRAKSIIGEL